MIVRAFRAEFTRCVGSLIKCLADMIVVLWFFKGLEFGDGGKRGSIGEGLSVEG